MNRKIKIRDVIIGAGAPVSVQSMCNTDTRDVGATLRQISALTEAGCEIVRVAVPDMEAAAAIGQIVVGAKIPVVADIHFDYRLALECAKNGIDKIRINPGNIGSRENVKKVADACKERGIPIRIGVNSGSVEQALLEKYGVTAAALCESALGHIKILNDCNFDDICISIKSSNVFKTVEAYRLMRQKSDYPLHLGVTEAGSEYMGTIKSAAAFGALLMDGIGDTIRVSLTDEPVLEIKAARDILKALDMNKSGVTIVSCPTCGRTCVDLISLAHEIESRLAGVKTKLTVAVMGCVVNGPGEAREADIGIAGGKGEGIIIKKGEILRKVPEDRLADELIAEISKMTGEVI